ncbi:MAG TPA: hypothetical protein ENN20_10485 [Candidatus Marinimicrobia bacterium]|nr:hypothetical protein [Candidatus Neomarinimicrobiota bacterium]
MRRKKISTSRLIKLVTTDKDKVIEVSLNNGFFNATHFLSFGGRKLYDVGIDSQDITWLPGDFASFYRGAFWKIDQIISKCY